MSRQCGWCGKFFVKETPVGLITTGICRECADKMLKQMEADDERRPEKTTCRPN